MKLRQYLGRMIIGMISIEIILFLTATATIQHQQELWQDILSQSQSTLDTDSTMIAQIDRLMETSWSLEWFLCTTLILGIFLQVRLWKRSLEGFILPIEEIDDVIKEFRSGNKLRRYNTNRKKPEFVEAGRLLNKILDDK